MKRILLKIPTGITLCICFFLFSVLSWILLLRDGRAMYAIADFYPQVLPLIKYLEPHLVRYGVNSIPTILFFLTALIAIGSYLVSLRQNISTNTTIIFTIIFQCIVFFSYPILATDIFSYIMSDRISVVYDKNVWTTKPDEFTNDRFLRLADWTNTTRVYGGINQAIYTIPSLIGGNDLMRNVVAYRITVWIFTLGTLWLLYYHIKQHFGEKQNMMLRLLLWNPLLTLEIVSSGHNDIIMIFFMIGSYLFFIKQKYLFSSVALACAVQVKLIAILLLPFLIIWLLRKMNIKAMGILLVGFTISNLLIFSFMGIDPISFLVRVNYNLGVYWQGLPAVVYQFFPQGKLFFTGGFIVLTLVLLFYQWRHKIDPVTAYGICTLFYLLFFASAYWNWYVLWVFCFIPFFTSRRLILTAVIFTCTSLLAYPIFWVSLRYNNEHIFWYIFKYCVIFLIPAIIFIKKPTLSFLGIHPERK